MRTMLKPRRHLASTMAVALFLSALSLASLATPGSAETTAAQAAPALPAHPEAEAQALDLAKRAIALRSVEGPGNKTGEVARLLRAALVQGGYAPAC